MYYGPTGQHLGSPRVKRPFSITYGAEAVIPLESGFPTMKSRGFTLEGNEELLKRNLDLIEERRENARVQLAYYQHKLKQGYDLSVKLRPLAPGDLVLRRVVGNAKNPSWGKLGPNWEAVSHHGGGRNRSLLLRRFRRESCTSPLECK